MIRKPFMSLKRFEALLAAKPVEGWWMAQEILSRWQWVCTGNVDLPVEYDGDLLTRARMALRAAHRSYVPVFPLAPGEYIMTAGEVHNLVPRGLRGQMVVPKNRRESVIWGSALGGIPELYRDVAGALGMPGTFLDRASAAGGESSFDAVTGHEVPGYGFNAFEAWLLGQEKLVYWGCKLRDQTGAEYWSGGDPLADRRIRAFYAGYRLDRSCGQGAEQVVWEAIMLPIPVLAWWLRYWVRSVDSGMWAMEFAQPENRDRIITVGLGAIGQHGGWPAYADLWENLLDRHVAVEFDGRQIPLQLSGGMIALPEEYREVIGNDRLEELFGAVAADLPRFGFRVLPVTF